TGSREFKFLRSLRLFRMAATNLPNYAKTGAEPRGKMANRGQFSFTFVDSSSTLGSIFRQIRERLREPKITVPREYYRGETRLPITEIRQWHMDLPARLHIAFEEPRDSVGKFNRTQTIRRAVLELGMGVLAAVG